MASPQRQLIGGTLTATGLALILALPALFARPWADERLYLYWPERIAGRNPLRLIPWVLGEIPGYLELGVFRWLSRLLTFAENWVLVRTSLAVGLPVNVVRAIPKILMVAFMAAVLIWTMDQYRRAAGVDPQDRSYRMLLGTVIVVFAASLTLFNPATHPLTLFPTLYLGTAGFALAMPLALGRMRLRELANSQERPSWVLAAVGFLVLGMAIASMIELAYLALPLGLLHLASLDAMYRRQRHGLVRRTIRSRAGRMWLAMVGGFLVVFVPTRAAISGICADGSCYPAADPSLGAELVVAWPLRILAGFFPALQVAQIRVAERVLRVDREVWILAILAAFLAAWVIVRAWRAGDHRPGSVRWLGPVALYYGVALVMATGLTALTRAVQVRGVDISPWRETCFSWVAWTALVSIGVLVVIQRAPKHWVRLLLGGGLVAAVFLASVQNQADLIRVRSQPESRLHNQIAVLLVDFDRTPEGDAARCAAVSELVELFDSESQRVRMEFLGTILDDAARNHYGTRFCEGG